MSKIGIERLFASPLDEPQNGKPVPLPLLQPGMKTVYRYYDMVREGIVEEVHFKRHTLKYPARYVYRVFDCEINLYDSSIISSHWPEEGSRPDFLNAQEYYIDVERRRSNNIRAVVQVQTSLKPGANVVLLGVDANELYVVRKTTLEKMIARKKSQQAKPPQDLHKQA